eukprot:COSAG05_NODE_331_length_11273_cov_3.896635_2_plen_130_part_00
MLRCFEIRVTLQYLPLHCHWSLPAGRFPHVYSLNTNPPISSRRRLCSRYVGRSPAAGMLESVKNALASSKGIDPFGPRTHETLVYARVKSGRGLLRNSVLHILASGAGNATGGRCTFCVAVCVWRCWPP